MLIFPPYYLAFVHALPMIMMDRIAVCERKEAQDVLCELLSGFEHLVKVNDLLG